MIFSAVDWASTSEARSCGVTMLSTVAVWGDKTERRIGGIAARHCPGLRSYVTIENFEMSAMQMTSRSQRYDVNGPARNSPSTSARRWLGPPFFRLELWGLEPEALCDSFRRQKFQSPDTRR